MIQTKGLSKHFGAIRALQGLDLEIERGTKTAILGPNGSGKSTLLKLCVGLIRPSFGNVTIDSKPPRHSRSAIGYLGHESYLYPHLTVRENIEMFASLFGVGPEHGVAIVEELQLTHRIDSPVGELSRGEVQKAAFARCMLHQPELLILDEPLSGLDETSVRVVEKRLDESLMTVVLATHLMTPQVSSWTRIELHEGRRV